jgi:hypothetical protein
MMSPSRRYDDPRSTPEYIAKEKKRKRIVNRQAFIRRWWPRIEAEVKKEKERGEEEHRSD